jgi:hypothetical protein
LIICSNIPGASSGALSLRNFTSYLINHYGVGVSTKVASLIDLLLLLMLSDATLLNT